jgi:hypothetical protein
VPLAEKETMLQGMADRLIEIWRYYGMEVNVGKTQVMRISRQSSPGQIMIDQKQLENLEYLKYFGRVITSDARCIRGIKSGIAMAKPPFSKTKNLQEKIE